MTKKESFFYVVKWALRATYHPFLYLLYWTTFLSPRKKYKWIFVPHRQIGFADNCKYFYLYLSNKQKIDNPVWITRDKTLVKVLNKKGYCAYYCFSIKGILSLLQSEYFIFDSYLSGIYLWLSGGSKKVNLWHGVGIKKSDNDIKKGKLAKIFQSKGIKKIILKTLAPHVFLNSHVDYFFCTSPLYKKISASAFGTKKENIFITGYPRNDLFFYKIKNMEIGTDFVLQKTINNAQKNGKKIILYTPTFRDTNEDIFKDETVKALERIEKFCDKKNILFIFKPHPNSYKSFKKDGIKKLNNIYFADPNSDIYPLLPKTDVLITDYSSISSDYLLLNKPIIFFPYDMKKYKEKDRDFYFDYESFSPGIKTYNLDSLINAMEETITDDKFEKEREKIRDKYFKYIDGKSSQRILSSIIKK